jgi:hypothetical protein
MNQAGFAYPAGGKALVQLSVFRGSRGAAEGLTVSSSPAGAGLKPNTIAGKTAPDSMTNMTVICQF